MYRLIFRAKISDAIRHDEEHYADQKAIEAGCTWGIYMITIMNNQKPGRKGDRKFYMTLGEIEKNAREIGQWDEKCEKLKQYAIEIGQCVEA